MVLHNLTLPEVSRGFRLLQDSVVCANGTVLVRMANFHHHLWWRVQFSNTSLSSEFNLSGLNAQGFFHKLHALDIFAKAKQR